MYLNNSNQQTYLCHDCGKPLDTKSQDDGKGGSYIIVTCWNPHCLLRTVTRSLDTYTNLSDAEWEAYRQMNRPQDASIHHWRAIEDD